MLFRKLVLAMVVIFAGCSGDEAAVGTVGNATEDLATVNTAPPITPNECSAENPCPGQQVCVEGRCTVPQPANAGQSTSNDTGLQGGQAGASGADAPPSGPPPPNPDGGGQNQSVGDMIGGHETRNEDEQTTEPGGRPTDSEGGIEGAIEMDFCDPPNDQHPACGPCTRDEDCMPRGPAFFCLGTECTPVNCVGELDCAGLGPDVTCEGGICMPLMSTGGDGGLTTTDVTGGDGGLSATDVTGGDGGSSITGGAGNTGGMGDAEGADSAAGSGGSGDVGGAGGQGGTAPMVVKSCTDDEDCDPTRYCGPDGFCIPPCVSQNDCDGERFCDGVTGQCMTPNCDDFTGAMPQRSCDSHETCNRYCDPVEGTGATWRCDAPGPSGQCVPRCIDDTECRPHQFCDSDGVCQPLPCEFLTDLVGGPASRSCVDDDMCTDVCGPEIGICAQGDDGNRCQPPCQPTPGILASCSEGQICGENQRCRPLTCADFQRIDGEAAAQNCRDTAQCETVCNDVQGIRCTSNDGAGYCTDLCETDDHCGDAQTCSEESGHCVDLTCADVTAAEEMNRLRSCEDDALCEAACLLPHHCEDGRCIPNCVDDSACETNEYCHDGICQTLNCRQVDRPNPIKSCTEDSFCALVCGNDNYVCNGDEYCERPSMCDGTCDDITDCSDCDGGRNFCEFGSCRSLNQLTCYPEAFLDCENHEHCRGCGGGRLYCQSDDNRPEPEGSCVRADQVCNAFDCRTNADCGGCNVGIGRYCNQPIGWCSTVRTP